MVYQVNRYELTASICTLLRNSLKNINIQGLGIQGLGIQGLGRALDLLVHYVN